MLAAFFAATGRFRNFPMFLRPFFRGPKRKGLSERFFFAEKSTPEIPEDLEVLEILQRKDPFRSDLPVVPFFCRPIKFPNNSRKSSHLEMPPLGWHAYPKDPSVLKIVRRSNP